MPPATPPEPVVTQIEAAVARFVDFKQSFIRFAKVLHTVLTDNEKLSPFIHFSKYREKDPEHLRYKLVRKFFEAQEEKKEFLITADNLFTEVGDLAGVRLIHLHTSQLSKIHPLILSIFEEAQYELHEQPTA